MTDRRGIPMYHHSVVSLKVLERSFHFKYYKDHMITIYMLMKATCSYGLLLQSNFASEGNLTFFDTWAPQISSEKGIWYRISVSSICFDSWWRCWRFKTLYSKGRLWQCKSSIAPQNSAIGLWSPPKLSSSEVVALLFTILGKMVEASGG